MDQFAGVKPYSRAFAARIDHDSVVLGFEKLALATRAFQASFLVFVFDPFLQSLQEFFFPPVKIFVLQRPSAVVKFKRHKCCILPYLSFQTIME